MDGLLFPVAQRRHTQSIAKTNDAILTIAEFNVTITHGVSKSLVLPESQVAVGNLYTVNAASATHTVTTASAELTPNNLLTGADDLGISTDLNDTEAAVFLSLGNYWFMLMHTTAAS